MDFGDVPAPTLRERVVASLRRKWQQVLDRTVIWTKARWAGFGALLLVFLARALFAGGWFIVVYGLGIYLLNLFIGFITPAMDPEKEGPMLPMGGSEEMRFDRRLPEFKFWYWATRATVVALFMTLFPLFNVPVYWPILVVYFASLLFVTLKKQIRMMVKYRYVPFSFGKRKYTTKEPVNYPGGLSQKLPAAKLK